MPETAETRRLRCATVRVRANPNPNPNPSPNPNPTTLTPTLTLTLTVTLTLTKCAVVSNAGILARREYGAEIDAHECVWRMNRAPTVGFEKQGKG